MRDVKKDGHHLQGGVHLKSDYAPRIAHKAMENSKRIHELNKLISKQQWDKMTDEDWETLLAAISEKQDWEQMWQLAQVAPAMWSVRLLLRLKDAAWRPEQETERSVFMTLTRLAKECGKKEADILVTGLVHCYATLEGNAIPIEDIVISSDGQVLINEQRLIDPAPLAHYIVKLWSLPDRKTLKTLQHDEVISSVAQYDSVSPDSEVVQAITDKHISSIAISPDGRMLAIGETVNYTEYGREIPGAWELGITDREVVSENSLYTVRLWSLPDGAPLQTLEGHSGEVTCLAFSSDGRLLASGAGMNRYGTAAGTAADTTVRVWRLSDGAALHTLEGHTGGITCLAFSPDGQLLVSGAGLGGLNRYDYSTVDTTVRVWRLSDGAVLHTLEGHSNRISGLAISPNGQVLASRSFDTIRLWSLPDGKVLHTLKWPRGSISCLVFSPDGQILAYGGSSGYPGKGTVRLWSLRDGTALKTLKGHISEVTCLAFSPDGRILASGSWDKTVRLWRLPNGKTLQTLEGHTGAVDCLAISPDGRVLASGSRDGTVRLWSLGLADPRHLIVGQLRLEEVKLLQDKLQEGKMTTAERKWLEFILVLMRWQRRFQDSNSQLA